MVQDILVNGWLILRLEKVEDVKHGQMVLYMRDIGKIIKQLVREDLFMQMEMFMMVNGSMIKLME